MNRNEQARARRARNRGAIDPQAEWHGTTNGYVNHCCRCDACRAAFRGYHDEWRKRPEVAVRIRERARVAARSPHRRLAKKAAQYGIDAETLGAHLDERVCFACGATDVDLVVDHDHACCDSRYACGACVRGLLCDGCNKALGAIGDNLGRLRCLVEYLERWEARGQLTEG